MKVRKLNVIKGSTLNHFIEKVNERAERRIEFYREQFDGAIEVATKEFDRKRQLRNAVMENLLHDNAMLKVRLGQKIHS